MQLSSIELAVVEPVSISNQLKGNSDAEEFFEQSRRWRTNDPLNVEGHLLK
jgi:hypothetical protein